MPQLTKVLHADELQRRAVSPGMDLTPYRDLLQEVVTDDGLGAVVTLSPDEQQRTEKRRLSLAAKDLGYQLVWRKAASGQLRFVLAKPGEPAPGGRRRRDKPAPAPVETPKPAAAKARARGAGRRGRKTA